LKQSQLDMAACNLLYKAEDYGNAAFHLQQAVEKHTKYILLHGKLMPEGKKTHLPVPAFLEEFIAGINNFKDLAEKHNNYFLDDESSHERRELIS
jgi:HEPN domain-containing protein